MSGKGILENVRRYRAIASLYRQTAAFRPLQRLSLLEQAFEWERRALAELEAHFTDRLSLERLPPFAPVLNPVEALWSWLKYSQLNNFAPRDPAELDGRVIAELTAIRDDQTFLRGLFHASELPLPLTLLS